MQFRNQAKNKVDDLSGTTHKSRSYQLNFICRVFSKNLKGVITHPMTVKIGNSFVYSSKPKFPGDNFECLDLVFSLTKENNDGYWIDNINFREQ